MWNQARNYDLLEFFYNVMSGNLSDYKAIKMKIKGSIRLHDKYEWFATCILYDNLTLYTEIIRSVKMHTWWIVTQKLPHIFKETSSIMAIIMGGQPCKLQRNFDSKTCKLCSENSKDDLTHVLFNCLALSELRNLHLYALSNVMPQAMKNTFDTMSVNEKIIFMLSPLHSGYIPEWNVIYIKIASFVQAIYKMRAKLYDEALLVP